MSLYEDKLICINNNVLNYYSIDGNMDAGSLGERTSVELQDIKVQGKVSCYDNILVVSEPARKTVLILDVSDINRPIVLDRISVNGTVGIATITDSYIIIPVTYEGVLILER